MKEKEGGREKEREMGKKSERRREDEVLTQGKEEKKRINDSIELEE